MHINHNMHHSDVGAGIKHVYVPPLISFPSLRFLLSKSVFSGISFTRPDVEACDRRAGRGKADLPPLAGVNHVTTRLLPTPAAPFARAAGSAWPTSGGDAAAAARVRCPESLNGSSQR